MQPITLGFLVVSKNHENRYATELAKHSAKYNIQCVKFEPTSINPSTLMINGEKFDQLAQVWKSESFPIPVFIYDRCFYHRKDKTNKSRPIVDWLKKYPNTTFLGFGLPDKWEIYTALQTDSIISCYLPKTEIVRKATQILRRLNKDATCLLKPISGSRGTGIIAMKQHAKSITITYHKGSDKKTKDFHSVKEFTGWCEKLLHHQTYLLQPLLPLVDTQGYPFDIRLLLQKDETGSWCLAGKGIRKGYYGSFLSNLYSGGEALTYEDWSSNLTSTQKIILEDDLNTIIKELPKLLEEKFDRLFEIGVDVGYAQDGSVWILDINSKPGRKTLTETQPQLSEKLFQAPLAFCNHLANLHKGVEINE